MTPTMASSASTPWPERTASAEYCAGIDRGGGAAVTICKRRGAIGGLDGNASLALLPTS
jgi:hypothetical protein